MKIKIICSLLVISLLVLIIPAHLSGLPKCQAALTLDDSDSLQSYRFNIGKFECIVVNDGTFDGATAQGEGISLFSNAPKDILNERIAAYNLNPDKIIIPINCLIVNTGKLLVLLDTGYGEFAKRWPTSKNAAKLLPNLLRLGITPEEFNIVIITHHHPDHVGGIISNGKPTFPNARYYVWKSEWDRYLKKVKRYQAIKEKVTLLEIETEIVPGITVIPTPGHTVGHVIVSIKSANQDLLFISDLLGHPIHVEYPDWSMSHEHDLVLAAQNRRRILEKAERMNTLIHSFHLDFPGLGHVVSNEAGLKWQPIKLK
jgi:glyoxylase-like metal-dependent hydrolase (beta-lactamase superfamily II)